MSKGFFSAKINLFYLLHFRLWNLIKKIHKFPQVLTYLLLTFELMGIKNNFRTRWKTPNNYANLPWFLLKFYKRKGKLYNEKILALKKLFDIK